MKLTKDQAKASGYTHIAYRKNDCPNGRFKKGDNTLVRFNADTGGYESGPLTQLLNIEQNWDVREL